MVTATDEVFFGEAAQQVAGILFPFEITKGTATVKYEYGDAVDATYTPTTFDPTPITRRGIVVDPHFDDEYTEVFFGTLDEYEADTKAAQQVTGVFFPSEITKAGA